MSGVELCKLLYSPEVKLMHGTNPNETLSGPCDCGISNNVFPGKLNYTTPGHSYNQSKCKEAIAAMESKFTDEVSKTYFTFSYTEGAPNPNNFNEPFNFFLKTGARVFGSVLNTKLVNMYWKEVEVQTDKGILYENIEIIKSLSLDSTYIDTLDRGANKKANEVTVKGQPPGPVDQSYIEFNLYSSNNKVIFVRKYTKIVDVFANIGGLVEIFGFVIMFCYAWYNGIRMEQKLLNFGVLNQKKERDNEQKQQKTGQQDTEWEKSRLFSFGELLKFGLIEKKIGCCVKSDRIMKRMKFYQEAKEAHEQRTDVINIMKSVADIDTIKEALLTPYQQRLICYLAMRKADDDSNEKEMTINEATAELMMPTKKITPLQQDMDKYLKQNLPKKILIGKFTEEMEDDGEESKVHLSKRRISQVRDVEMEGLKSPELSKELPFSTDGNNSSKSSDKQINLLMNPALKRIGLKLPKAFEEKDKLN